MRLFVKLNTDADPDYIQHETKQKWVSFRNIEGAPFECVFEVSQPFVDNLAKLQKFESTRDGLLPVEFPPQPRSLGQQLIHERN